MPSLSLRAEQSVSADDCTSTEAQKARKSRRFEPRLEIRTDLSVDREKLAVDAVCREPVSTCFALITGPKKYFENPSLSGKSK